MPPPKSPPSSAGPAGEPAALETDTLHAALASPSPSRLQSALAAFVALGAHPLARLLSPAVGVGMVALLVAQAADIGWATIAEVWPASPWFYLAFLVSYLAPIWGELVIYRLWGVRMADAPMLLKKRVMNDALLSYSGEAYAVVWARARGVAAPHALGTVKDVNIMSAVVGILSTVLLLGATLLAADGAKLAAVAIERSGPALGLALAIMGAALAFIALKPRLFHLGAADLRFAVAVNAARVLIGIVATVAMWAAALPGVALTLWITLAAWRSFFARMPIPNKELLFVNLAILALGEGGREVAALLAATAALTVAAHLLTLVGCAFVRRPAEPLPA